MDRMRAERKSMSLTSSTSPSSSSSSSSLLQRDLSVRTDRVFYAFTDKKLAASRLPLALTALGFRSIPPDVFADSYASVMGHPWQIDCPPVSTQSTMRPPNTVLATTTTTTPQSVPLSQTTFTSNKLSDAPPPQKSESKMRPRLPTPQQSYNAGGKGVTRKLRPTVACMAMDKEMLAMAFEADRNGQGEEHLQGYSVKKTETTSPTFSPNFNRSSPISPKVNSRSDALTLLEFRALVQQINVKYGPLCRCHDAFAAFDVQGRGLLAKQDVRDALQQLAATGSYHDSKRPITEEQVNFIFSVLDRDRDGFISYSEFRSIAMTSDSLTEEEKLEDDELELSLSQFIGTQFGAIVETQYTPPPVICSSLSDTVSEFSSGFFDRQIGASYRCDTRPRAYGLTPRISPGRASFSGLRGGSHSRAEGISDCETSSSCSSSSDKEPVSYTRRVEMHVKGSTGVRARLHLAGGH